MTPVLLSSCRRLPWRQMSTKPPSAVSAGLEFYGAAAGSFLGGPGPGTTVGAVVGVAAGVVVTEYIVNPFIESSIGP